MVIILQPIILFAVCFAVRFFNIKTSNASQSNEKELRLNKAYCVVSYVSLVFFCILTFYLYFVSGIYAALVGIAFSVLPTLLIIGYYGYRIIYNENNLEIKFFRKNKCVKLSDIVQIERGFDLLRNFHFLVSI